MTSLLSSAASTFRNLREQLAPIPKTSAFSEKGTLTPEEFVAAGDLLVAKCPTWQWAAGEKDKKKDYLPMEKQYLITKSVPSLRRAAELETEAGERVVSGEGDDANGAEEEQWVETHVGHAAKERVVTEIEDIVEEPAKKDSNTEQERPADDEIPDIDEEDLLAADSGVVEVADPAALKQGEDNIVRTRTYDLRWVFEKWSSPVFNIILTCFTPNPQHNLRQILPNPPNLALRLHRIQLPLITTPNIRRHLPRPCEKDGHHRTAPA